MEAIILAIGTLCIGAFSGLVLGFFSAKKMGLTPSARELRTALKDCQDRYKSMNNRWRGRIKEYEQPSELQQIANSGAEGDDMVNMILQNIGGVKSLPRWVRPFLPAIQSYIKENPDKVQAVIQRFVNQQKGGEESNNGDDQL